VSIASRKITRIYGFMMYLTAVLQTIAVNYESPRMRITLDDRELDQEIMMFVIANGPREGGGFHVAPEAEMDDGLLNYIYIEKVGRAMMLRLLPEVMNATHMRFKQVIGGTAKRITIESDRGLPIHTDGEIFGPWEADIRYIEAEIIPGALRVAM
jgi:diacylglycerol kinase family enzyme